MPDAGARDVDYRYAAYMTVDIRSVPAAAAATAMILIMLLTYLLHCYYNSMSKSNLPTHSREFELQQWLSSSGSSVQLKAV